LTRRASDGLLEATGVIVGAGTVSTRHSYDNHGELWKLRYERNGALLFEQVLGRDSLGRVRSVTESGLAAHVHEYRYDPAGRLDEVKRDGVVQRTYVYDDSLPGNGNRTAEKDGSGTALARAHYDAQDRLTDYGAAVYTWTANGELAKKVVAGTDTTRYTYDALGNLVAVALPSGQRIEYLIDGRNRRVARRVDGVLERQWLYQDGVSPVAELDGAGTLQWRYVYGTRGHVPDLAMHGDTAYRVVSDQLGSVRALVRTSDGVIAWWRNYDAWGNVTQAGGTLAPSLGYAGGLTDAATGLVRFGARDYDPGVGRWTAKDPILDVRAPSAYSYSESQPVSLTDTDGLMASAQECEAILRKIRNLEESIAKRTGEIRENPRDLPWTCTGDRDSPRLSIRGHIKLINTERARLAFWKAVYLAKCGGRPPGGLPGPGESFFDEKYWENVTGLTGSALIAYLLVSEGSRLFPPRNLVPVP